MGYQRTTKGALQRWADEVNDQSWAYENVSQYYNKSLSFAPTDMSKRIGNATPYYDTSTLGNNSPLKLAYTNYTQAISTLFSKLLEAVGIMLVHGFTSGALNGSAFLMGTINHTVGNIDSSERAFLRPFLDQPILSVFNGMLAEKIVFDGVVLVEAQIFDNWSIDPVHLSIDQSICKWTGPFVNMQFIYKWTEMVPRLHKNSLQNKGVHRYYPSASLSPSL